MRTVDQMVHQEVMCCMSSIVATLGNPSGFRMSDRTGRDQGMRELISLCEQAVELASPIDDYEEAARQAGWSYDKTGGVYIRDGALDDDGYTPADGHATNWQQLCEAHEIEPCQREVFEHWAVTDWFADQLAEQGEKVDKDFGGLCIWARTTTGQGIAQDDVVQRIHAALMKS